MSLVPPGKDATLASTNLQISGEGLQIGAQKFNATLTGSGPLHALQLTLAAQAPVLGKPASLKAQGQLQASQKRLNVTMANATVHAVDLKLEQPALVDFAQGLAVSGLRISAADAHLQVAIAAADLASAQTITLASQNPGSGNSNNLTLTIQ